MTSSKCAVFGSTGSYAVVIIFSCLLIEGAFSRSARSTDRHDNSTVRCDAVKAIFDNTNVTYSDFETFKDASGTADSEYTFSSPSVSSNYPFTSYSFSITCQINIFMQNQQTTTLKITKFIIRLGPCEYAKIRKIR